MEGMYAAGAWKHRSGDQREGDRVSLPVREFCGKTIITSLFNNFIQWKFNNSGCA